MECTLADLDEMIEIAHFTGGNFRALSPALFLLPLMYAHSPVCILMCVKDGNNFLENECKYVRRARDCVRGGEPHFDNRSVSRAEVLSRTEMVHRKVVNFSQAQA